MDKTNIVKMPSKETAVESVLEQAKQHNFKDIIIIGMDGEGEFGNAIITSTWEIDKLALAISRLQHMTFTMMESTVKEL